MVDGGQAMAAKLEQIVGLAVAGENPLGMPQRPEPLHLPFSPPCRLVRDLRPIVRVAALSALDPGQDSRLGAP